jgi:hypothetical protein
MEEAVFVEAGQLFAQCRWSDRTHSGRFLISRDEKMMF